MPKKPNHNLHFKAIDKKVLILANCVLFLVIILTLMHFELPFYISKQGGTSNNSINNIYSVQARKLFDKCVNFANRDKCYGEELVKITGEQGMAGGEKTLYELMALDSFIRHCHTTSHKIANFATRQNPDNWKKLLEEVNYETCGGGFLHGIIEAHVGYSPNFKINKESIEEICGLSDKIKFKQMSCTHIMGHLLMVETEGNLKVAEPVCYSFKTPILSLECFTGIFMEDSFKTSLTEHGLAELPIRDKPRMERQSKRCLKYDGTASEACWTDLAEIFVEYYNYDSKKSYDSCYSAPYQSAREHCYLKAVVLMAISPNYDNQKSLIGECEFYKNNPSLYKKCTYFVISALMHYSPEFSNRAKLLCNNIDESLKNYCFTEFGKQLMMNVNEKSRREIYCQGSLPAYKHLCVN